MAGRLEQLRQAMEGAARLGRRAAKATQTASWRPAAMESVAVNNQPGAPLLPRGKRFRILTWNVQFCAGRRQEFFYDGGDAVSVPVAELWEMIDRFSTALAEIDADIVLLQEVDRGSARTHRVDELQALLERAPYPCWTSTPYHRVLYLPFPPREHLGRTELHLTMLSRFSLGDAQRIALPLLRENVFRRRLNLRRAILETGIPIDGGGTFTVMSTHLSAFSLGDGTLPRQVEVVAKRAADVDSGGQPWLLAGDFNALPPGDDPSRLRGDEAEWYQDAITPVTRMFQSYRCVWTEADYQADPEPLFTYIPYSAPSADRTLDYVFLSAHPKVLHREVLHQYRHLSDHLPVVVDLEL